MSWADLIERAARAAASEVGVTVVPWHDWRFAGHGTTAGRLLGTMWHDTVTPYSWSDAQLLRLLRQGYKALPGPIANVGIGSTGNLLLVAAGRAYHAGSGRWPGIPSGNLNTVGVEVQNPGTVPWRDVQLRVARRFTFHLHRYAGLTSSRLVGHKEWAPTRKRDPHSVDMPFERTLLARTLTTPAHAPPPPPEPSTTWLEDLMSAGEKQLADIATALQRDAQARERQAAATRALAAVEVARHAALVRAQHGRQPDPQSDGIWGDRVAAGRHTLADVGAALKGDP